MFALPKLLVLALIIAAAWYAARWLKRRQLTRRQQDEIDRPPRSRDGGGRVVDTVRCPVCDAYIPAHGATPCGRAHCPQGG